MTPGAPRTAWTPETPARLVTSDPVAPFPWGAVTLGVLGGLVGACVMLVLILRGRERLYRAHAGHWAARRAASALRLSRGEAALAKKLADAGGSTTSAVLVSGEVLRLCAQTLCERGVSSAERARVAAMCERYGVRAPEVGAESPAKGAPTPGVKRSSAPSPKGPGAKRPANARTPVPPAKRRAG